MNGFTAPRIHDVYAVQVMGRSIELWTYRRYSDDTLHLEELVLDKNGPTEAAPSSKNPTMVAAGKKAALTRTTSTYSVVAHLEDRPSQIVELFRQFQEVAPAIDPAIDPAIEEAAKKYYVAYRTTQNIVCAEVQTKLDPKKEKGPHGISRDV